MRTFRRVLIGAMRSGWVTVALTVAVFALSILGMRFVPEQFFPTSERAELLVELKLAQNSSIYATERVATTLDAMLRDDGDIERWSTYIGRGAVRFYLPLNVQLTNDFLAEAVIVAKNAEARDRVRARLEQTLPHDLPMVVARIHALELGPRQPPRRGRRRHRARRGGGGTRHLPSARRETAAGAPERVSRAVTSSPESLTRSGDATTLLSTPPIRNRGNEPRAEDRAGGDHRARLA